jgi:2-polyprenyl-3-methyl-5-hydroxy-6-metoxy-1,4-benzoquinol methylase
MLAGVAREVRAIDRSVEAVTAAAARFQAANLTYQTADIADLSPDVIRCDLLVAMQVIEHLEDVDALLRLAAEATRPAGACILSTPNALLSVGENPYHAREFTPMEFERLLLTTFAKVELYGVHGSERAVRYHAQRRRLARAVLRLDFLRLRRVLPQAVKTRAADVLGSAVKQVLRRLLQTRPARWDDEYTVAPSAPDRALDVIALCRHA